MRLTWLRSFHNPVVVRVECGASCILISVRLSGVGGYEPGEIAESHRVRLSRSQKDDLLRLASDVLNYESPPDDEKSIVVDGARWIVEIVGADGYAASSTHGSDLRETSPLADLCDYLVSISKIEIPEGEYY